jgi:hypothetical protein
VSSRIRCRSVHWLRAASGTTGRSAVRPLPEPESRAPDVVPPVRKQVGQVGPPAVGRPAVAAAPGTPAVVVVALDTVVAVVLVVVAPSAAWADVASEQVAAPAVVLPEIAPPATSSYWHTTDLRGFAARTAESLLLPVEPPGQPALRLAEPAVLAELAELAERVERVERVEPVEQAEQVAQIGRVPAPPCRGLRCRLWASARAACCVVVLAPLYRP